MINLMRLSTQSDRLSFRPFESTHEDIEALIALFQDETKNNRNSDTLDTHEHEVSHANEIETHR